MVGICHHRRSARCRHDGLSQVELLVVVTVLAILTALLIPAVFASREASRRCFCANNLRQLGLAISNHEIANRRFPAGRVYYDQGVICNHSWATTVMVFIDEPHIANQYDRRLPWSEGSNFVLTQSVVPVMRCPSSSSDWPGVTDYGGNYGTTLTGLRHGFGIGRAGDSGVMLAIGVPRYRGRMGPTRHRPIRAGQIRDGLSKTLMLVEDAGRSSKQGGQWANGHNCLVVTTASVNDRPENEIYSHHSGGAHGLFAGGSVQLLTDKQYGIVLGELATRSTSKVRDQNVKSTANGKS